MTYKKFWLPIKGLAIFFVLFVGMFYFFLTAFDPHVTINPAEWEPKKRKTNFLIQVIIKQIKSHTK
jgi:hypothetical protein